MFIHYLLYAHFVSVMSSKMTKKEIIDELETIMLKMNKIVLADGDFDSRSFIFAGNEIGHIHKTGDLDIVFGKKITMALLKDKLVKRHLYMPEVAITFNVKSEHELPFAVALLRFSYLLTADENNILSQNKFNAELEKLPDSLSSIYLLQ